MVIKKSFSYSKLGYLPICVIGKSKWVFSLAFWTSNPYTRALPLAAQFSVFSSTEKIALLGAMRIGIGVSKDFHPIKQMV